MNTPLRSALRDTLLLILLLVATLLVPNSARAIQLRWSSGNTDLTVDQNTCAVLLVQADSAEVALPPTWCLLWTADSSGIQFAALDSASACLTDTARVFEVDPPATPADSATNQITTHFCSAGSAMASTAYFLVNIIGGSQGKLKVVALDLADTTNVIESNEVNYNGGVDGDYAPLILRATTVHQSAQFSVTLEGTGLAATDGLDLVAANASWRFPLSVDARSDAIIHASAVLAAPLPACTIEVMKGGGSFASTELSADSLPAPEIPQDYCFNFYPGALDTTHMQPEDFTFVFAHDGWHVFYIRRYQDAPGETTYTRHPEWNQRNFGHATSTDLLNWTVQARNVLQVPGAWDTHHVWAPHIVRKSDDITYFMFYTGVDANENQKIGVATSTDLVTWNRSTAPILAANRIAWADTNPPNPYFGQQQFRDPFVMEDPTTPGQWLMYFVTVAKDRTPGMVVGVAKTPLNGDFYSWSDLTPLWKTSSRLVSASRVESPHSFQHNGKWWVMYTPTYGAADTIRFEVNAVGPSNTDTTSWGPHLSAMNPSERLYSVTQGYENPWTFLNGWHATEYMHFRGGEYLAAYDDYNQSIDFVQLVRAASPDSFGIICPTNVGVSPTSAPTVRDVELGIAGAVPVVDGATFRLALPSVTHVDLAIYDVQGRRVRALLNGAVPAGTSRVTWDGRDAAGHPVRSGMYFARLLCPHAQRVARVPLIR